MIAVPVEHEDGLEHKESSGSGSSPICTSGWANSDERDGTSAQRRNHTNVSHRCGRTFADEGHSEQLAGPGHVRVNLQGLLNILRRQQTCNKKQHEKAGTSWRTASIDHRDHSRGIIVGSYKI